MDRSYLRVATNFGREALLSTSERRVAPGTGYERQRFTEQRKAHLDPCFATGEALLLLPPPPWLHDCETYRTPMQYTRHCSALLQVGEPYDRGRIQEFRKPGHGDGQESDHQRKVSDPVLPVGGLDLGHEFFLWHGLLAPVSEGQSLSLLFFSALLAFQILGIDPIVFSHVPADRGDEWAVFRQSVVVVEGVDITIAAIYAAHIDVLAVGNDHPG